MTLAPRLFLRELVDVLDRVDQHEAYDPAEHYKLSLEDDEAHPEELGGQARYAQPVYLGRGGDLRRGTASKAPRRLDG